MLHLNFDAEEQMVPVHVFSIYFVFGFDFCVLRSRQAGVIHRDTFKLSLSIDYTFLSF